MKGRFCCLVITLQIVSWVGATSRPSPPNDGISDHLPGLGQSSEYLKPTSKEVPLSQGFKNEFANYKRASKIGSSPPNCEHKCYGCIPCEAIQVRTTSSRHSHIGIQYTNYEPENWKCKCGQSFYNP